MLKAFSFSVLFNCTYKIKAQTTYTVSTTNVKGCLAVDSAAVMNGNVTTKDTLRAEQEVIAEKDIKVEGDMYVNGNINTTATSTANLGEVRAAGNIRTDGSFILNTPNPGDSPLGFRVYNPPAGSSNTGRIINLGNPLTFPPSILPCSLPNNNPWFQMNGGYIAKTTSLPVDASVSMYCAPWNGAGYIESEGTNQIGGNSIPLFLNYFCGNDVALCVNTGLANGGGKVSVGNFFSAQQHVEIGSPQWGIATNNAPANNIALDMHVNTGKAIRIRTNNGNLPMFEVVNTGLSKTTFYVNGNGQTFIGQQRVVANNPHVDALLQVSGKIACKELIVLDPFKWADFVFEKNYKLMPLNDVEEFYKKNKHLPDVPSEKEVKENGINTAEMDATLLQKIEELTLYMVEQNKRIEKLEKENETLKKKK